MTPIKPKLIFSILIIAFMASCRSHKMKKRAVEFPEISQIPNEKPVLVDTMVIKTKETKAEKVWFKTPQVDFDKLKIKSKINLKSAKIEQNIPATIHVKKDSVIWVSVAIGLEAARASINKDSLSLLDRLNRTYYQLSFKELSQKLQFEVNYDMIQSLIIGNMPINIDSSDVFEIAPDFNKIIQSRAFLKIVNFFEISKNQLLTIDAEDQRNQSKLKIKYEGFIVENNQIVPTLINLKVTDAKNQEATIDFEHNKLDFLDRNIRFPFNIPKGYKKGELPNF